MDYRYYYENRLDDPAPRTARPVRRAAAVGLTTALALAIGATATVAPAGALTGIEPRLQTFDPMSVGHERSDRIGQRTGQSVER